MKRLFAASLASVGVLFAVAGHATPLVPLKSTVPEMTIQVADGCWLGWHRNVNGGCSRDLYGLFGLGIDYRPGPYYPTPPNVCGGRGMYRVCNIFGYCWWTC